MSSILSREKSSIIRTFYSVILIELIIGGSGRIFEFGPITLRMIFFIIAIGISLLYKTDHKLINHKILFIQVFFLLLITLASFIGIINSADFSLILTDIKPLLFFFLISFFYIVINDHNDLDHTISLIKKCSIFLSISYLVVIFLLSTKLIDFLSFYYLADSGDIMFRTPPFFFYKGFLYLGIGVIFFFTTPGNKNKSISLFIFIVMCFTLTRGFILMTSIVLIFYIYIISRNITIKVISTFIVIFLFIFLFPVLNELIGDKAESDNFRIHQIKEVFEEITILSSIFGHGFGIGVPIRPVHMEIAYLEIFHKQGIIGLLFWSVLIVDIILMYIRIKKTELKRKILPFILSCVFIYLQSITNPFLNNPIGLTIIIITYVILIKNDRLVEIKPISIIQ